MQPSGKPETVRPEIAFYFGADPPERTPSMLRLGRQSIDIPAGERGLHDHGFVRAAGRCGRRRRCSRTRTTARVRCAASRRCPTGRPDRSLAITDWDFRWQDVYRFVEPLALPQGTTLSMAITYDNSAENPRNPWQPPRRVLLGPAIRRRDGRSLDPGADSQRQRSRSLEPPVPAEDSRRGHPRLRARDRSRSGQRAAARRCGDAVSRVGQSGQSRRALRDLGPAAACQCGGALQPRHGAVGQRASSTTPSPRSSAPWSGGPTTRRRTTTWPASCARAAMRPAPGIIFARRCGSIPPIPKRTAIWRRSAAIAATCRRRSRCIAKRSASDRIGRR